MQRGLLLVVLLVVVGTVPSPEVAEPTVALAVDGTSMASGDRLVVSEDPVLVVNASVRTTVERIVDVDDAQVSLPSLPSLPPLCR